MCVMNGYFPIDVKAISRKALYGYGPEDPKPLPVATKRLQWLRRQPTERPRSTPVAPSRARGSASSVPSSAK
jgi:hypothetical protein